MITAAIGLFIGGLGAWEIVVIIVVMGLIFGASRLPEIGSNLGKGIKNFKKSISELEEDKEQSKLDEGRTKLEDVEKK